MKKLVALCASIALCLTAAACGSSGGSTESGSSANGGSSAAKSGSASNGQSLKIGLITDVTGPASSAHVDDEAATKAYFNWVNQHGGVNGQKLELVTADTTSSPAGALTAAQKLVEHDKVFAIVDDSLLFFGAAPYLLKQGVPVVGSGIDGPEWFDPKNTNLFTPMGQTLNTTKYASLAYGQFMKDQGVTSCASVGYTGQPSSSASAQGFIQSCKAAGLKAGYLNTQLPIGSTDIGPIALAIQHSGADGLALQIELSTGIRIIDRLKQLGVHLKAAMLAEGYGWQLLSESSSVTAAQGIDFFTFGYPSEVHNKATDLRAKILKNAGLKLPPSAGAQYSYLNAVTFVAGLKAAGANPTRTKFIDTMRGIKNFDAGGLLPSKTDFSSYKPTTACVTVVKLVGKKFVPQKPMPLCAPMVKLEGS